MTDEKKMLIPNEEQFALTKVKIAKNGGLDVHYEVTEVIGDTSYTNKYHVESAKDIHPDLRKLFKDLRPIMARVFNITSFLSMIETDGYKATADQKKKARAFAEECQHNIEVKGVSLSGADDNVGCVLTGMFKVSNDQVTAINTPRMRFSTFSFGFEEQLEQIVGDIEKEVYAFLFKNKRGQGSLFGDDGEASDDLKDE